jgi:hypothetical protein
LTAIFVLFEKHFFDRSSKHGQQYCKNREGIVATNKISFASVHGNGKAVPFMASLSSKAQ